MKVAKHKRFTLTILASLSLLLTAGLLHAGQYKIVWSTIDGGGGVSMGGPYVLEGTIGQPDAAYSAGDNYEVLGGYWPGGPLCFVDFEHFARFAQYWLDTGDTPADLFEDGVVNNYDLDIFAYYWLYECPYNWPLK